MSRTNTNFLAREMENTITVQKLAKTIARAAGYGSATEIQLVDGGQPHVAKHTRYGYRKNTTGEYVPNSYRNNFGWKNTYYQQAETVVALPLGVVAECEDGDTYILRRHVA